MKNVSERYFRHNDVLGRGSCKTVYRAFDRTEGIEVAWNQVDLLQLGFVPTQRIQSSDWNKHIQQRKSEVQLLRTLHHKNIIRCYDAWFDDCHNTMIFITELCMSGTLREYMERYGHVDLKVIRSWARQILQGLVYLHGQKPPIAHRDLKCDNVFINGNTGEIKIGDLGLACVMQPDENEKRAVLGTPEYMAPEMLDGNYNELVDVYSFGMCVLEMLTVEYPYRECGTVAKTFDTVRKGKKPRSLQNVKDPTARDLIEKCLEPPDRRPPSFVLLDHRFFQKPECGDALTDQYPPKNPIEGTPYVGVELESAAPKAYKSPPPEQRRRPRVYMGDEPSYRGPPLMAYQFGMPEQASCLEEFDMIGKEIQHMTRHVEKVFEGMPYRMMNSPHRP